MSDDEKGVLVAVKIFEKSLLEKCRTIERDGENQMQVRTALENVEREIAVMKMIQHPNLVALYEVIDTGSNRLYMVLEWCPLGQIMTNVEGTGNYKRRPIRKGERKLPGVTPDGHFDEHHAALYFVDIMHGLAHLHKNNICHRDLKPEVRKFHIIDC
jgi:[calcium/calmodulin-dependent protein kinase] kinase